MEQRERRTVYMISSRGMEGEGSLLLEEFSQLGAQQKSLQGGVARVLRARRGKSPPRPWHGGGLRRSSRKHC